VLLPLLLSHWYNFRNAFYSHTYISSIQFRCRRPRKATTKNADISGEAERASAHALHWQVSVKQLLQAYFFTTIGVTAAAISSGVDSDDDQANGHGHGSGHGH
jgi:hypothetical protein